MDISLQGMMKVFLFFLQRTDTTKVDLKSKSINVLRSNLKFPKEGKKITKKKKLIFGISI